MESLPDQKFLKFHPDTLTYLRSQYSLDGPGEMDRAIDALENWLEKQNHFTVKSFPRSFLERQIILDKGSVERVKNQMEKLFTMKNYATAIVGKNDMTTDFKGLTDVFNQTLLPRLTKDHYRIYVTKAKEGFTAEQITQYFGLLCNIAEYVRVSDYCNGYIAILDHRDIKILDLVARMNLTELKQLLVYIMEGYQMRVKGLHIITTSKTVDVLVKILKQMFSEKMGKRIHVHMTLESLHEHVSKDCLPEELGGEQKSIYTLCDEFKDELCQKHNLEYFREMKKAVVDESLRVGVRHTKDYMLGVTGSFRTIAID